MAVFGAVGPVAIWPNSGMRTKRLSVFPQARKVRSVDVFQPMFIRVCTLRPPARKVRKVSFGSISGPDSACGGELLGQLGGGEKWQAHAARIVHQQPVAILLAVAPGHVLEIFHLHEV